MYQALDLNAAAWDPWVYTRPVATKPTESTRSGEEATRD